MKILQVIGTLNTGGAETFLVNVFKNIDREKYNFDFLVFKKEKYDYEDTIKKLGGKIIYIQSPKEIGMIKFISNFVQICKKNKYDVVHAHTLFNCGPCMVGAFLSNVKIRISHSHSTKYLDERTSFYKKIYYHISKLLINVFSTDYIACGNKAADFLYYKGKNKVIIKNGIELEKFRYSNLLNEKIRKLLGISNKAIVIGHVGRLMYIKNQAFLIDLFKDFHSDFRESYLILIGNGKDKEELINRVKKYNLEKYVIFTGSVPNVNEYYNIFDLFVFPSLFEGLPYTLIEAQANGIPIISSEDVSKESNITGEIKFLDLNSPKEVWLKEMKNRYGKRYEKMQKIIDNGYSIHKTINKLCSIYEKYNNMEKN